MPEVSKGVMAAAREKWTPSVCLRQIEDSLQPHTAMSGEAIDQLREFVSAERMIAEAVEQRKPERHTHAGEMREFMEIVAKCADCSICQNGAKRLIAKWDADKEGKMDDRQKYPNSQVFYEATKPAERQWPAGEVNWTEERGTGYMAERPPGDWAVRAARKIHEMIPGSDMDVARIIEAEAPLVSTLSGSYEAGFADGEAEAEQLRECEEALEAAKKWMPTLVQVMDWRRSENDLDALQHDSFLVEAALKNLRGGK